MKKLDARGSKYRDGQKQYFLARPLWNGGRAVASECNAEDFDFDMTVRSACGSLMRGVLIKIVFVSNIILEFRIEKPIEKL